MSPLARRVQDEGDSILGSGRAENPVWKFTERVYEIRYLDTTPLPGSAPTVYVPDWGGKLWAVSAATGQAIWSRTIASYDGIPGDVSRTSPAYYDGELVIGTGANRVSALRGAYVVGIDARTGAMLWRTRVDANLAAIVTGSPTADDGTKTTTGGGFFEALNAATGAIDWQVADPQGRFVDDSFVSSANGVMYAGFRGGQRPGHVRPGRHDRPDPVALRQRWRRMGRRGDRQRRRLLGHRLPHGGLRLPRRPQQAVRLHPHRPLTPAADIYPRRVPPARPTSLAAGAPPARWSRRSR